jgi:hypothetical protein
MLVAYRVVSGFEQAPASRPVHRWVMVPVGEPAAGISDADGQSARPVESSGQNPAA